MSEAAQPTLMRAIGRWSLAALMVNCIIGSGIFGLPSVVSGLVGNASPFAWLFASVATALVMACFAEVASRFERSGGVYLYTRTAFGRTVGISTAWTGWLARLTAAAANANLFVIYVAEFWPAAKNPIPRFLILTLLLAVLATVNYIGVRHGNLQSNIFTAGKLLTLATFVIASLLFLAFHRQPLTISLPTGSGKSWLHAILLLMFAFGGYETALMVGGEAKDPRRDYPFALLVALVVCTLVYTMTQWAIISVLPQSAATDRPMAAAAQLMFGVWSARAVSVGVLIASYGYLSANILGFPRILFAQAEHGDLPPAIATVHSGFRTPHVAIVIFAAGLWIFSLIGSFQWNVAISAMARLFYYGSVCAALPVLRRRRDVSEPQFRLPMGNLVAAFAITASLLLWPRLDRKSGLVLGILAVCVIVNTWWAIRRQEGGQAVAAK